MSTMSNQASPSTALENDTEFDARPFTEPPCAPQQGIDDIPDHLRVHLPSHLKKDNFEILILNDEEDEKEARMLKKNLEENVRYKKTHSLIPPKVELFSDVIYEDDSPTEELDFALSKTIFVYLFLTHKFCVDKWTLFKGQACLRKALQNRDSNLCVVNIETMPRGRREYDTVLPTTIGALRNFTYLSDPGQGNEDIYTGIQKMLECKTGIMLQKDQQLHNARLEYLSKLKERSSFPIMFGPQFNPEAIMIQGTITQSASRVTSNHQDAIKKFHTGSRLNVPDKALNNELNNDIETDQPLDVDSTLLKTPFPSTPERTDLGDSDTSFPSVDFTEEQVAVPESNAVLGYNGVHLCRPTHTDKPLYFQGNELPNGPTDSSTEVDGNAKSGQFLDYLPDLSLQSINISSES